MTGDRVSGVLTSQLNLQVPASQGSHASAEHLAAEEMGIGDQVEFKVLHFDRDRLKLKAGDHISGELFIYVESEQPKLQMIGYVMPGTVKREEANGI